MKSQLAIIVAISVLSALVMAKPLQLCARPTVTMTITLESWGQQLQPTLAFGADGLDAGIINRWTQPWYGCGYDGERLCPPSDWPIVYACGTDGTQKCDIQGWSLIAYSCGFDGRQLCAPSEWTDPQYTCGADGSQLCLPPTTQPLPPCGGQPCSAPIGVGDPLLGSFFSPLETGYIGQPSMILETTLSPQRAGITPSSNIPSISSSTSSALSITTASSPSTSTTVPDIIPSNYIGTTTTLSLSAISTTPGSLHSILSSRPPSSSLSASTTMPSSNNIPSILSSTTAPSSLGVITTTSSNIPSISFSTTTPSSLSAITTAPSNIPSVVSSATTPSSLMANTTAPVVTPSITSSITSSISSSSSTASPTVSPQPLICGVRGTSNLRAALFIDRSGNSASRDGCSYLCSTYSSCVSFSYDSFTCSLYSVPAASVLQANPRSAMVFYDLSCITNPQAATSTSSPTVTATVTSTATATCVAGASLKANPPPSLQCGTVIGGLNPQPFPEFDVTASDQFDCADWCFASQNCASFSFDSIGKVCSLYTQPVGNIDPSSGQAMFWDIGCFDQATCDLLP